MLCSKICRMRALSGTCWAASPLPAVCSIWRVSSSTDRKVISVVCPATGAMSTYCLEIGSRSTQTKAPLHSHASPRSRRVRSLTSKTVQPRVAMASFCRCTTARFLIVEPRRCFRSRFAQRVRSRHCCCAIFSGASSAADAARKARSTRPDRSRLREAWIEQSRSSG